VFKAVNFTQHILVNHKIKELFCLLNKSEIQQNIFRIIINCFSGISMLTAFEDSVRMVSE